MNILLNTIILTSLFISNSFGEIDKGFDKKAINKDTLDLSGNGIDFGVGHDSFTKEKRGNCLKFNGTRYVGGTNSNTNAQTSFELKMIESSSKLSRHLSIDAAASLKGLWGKGSVVANYLKKQEMSSYSLYILVKSEVKSPYQNIVDPKLKEDARVLAVANPEAFRRTCGDEFVQSISHGGKLIGILKLETSDRITHEEIKVAVKAKVGTFKGSVDFAKALRSATKNRNFEVLTTIVGGSFDTNTTSIEALMEKAIQFPKLIGANPLPVSAETISYETLLDYPFQQDRISTAIASGNIKYLNNLYLHYRDLRDNIQYIKENPVQFTPHDSRVLHRKQNLIFNEIIKIQTKAQHCFEDYEKCQVDGDFNFIEIDLPARLPNISGNLLCKEREHEVCGHVYQNKESDKCEPASFNEGSGPECGPKEFRLARSNACGVERYNSHAAAPCPTATRMVNRQVSGRAYCGGNPRHGDEPVCYRDVEETYHLSCEHPNFGAALFKECRHKSHGDVDHWPTCRHKKFGAASYKSCEHPDHGILYTKVCKVREYINHTSGERIVEKCN